MVNSIRNKPYIMVPGSLSEVKLPELINYPKIIEGNYDIIGEKQGGQNSSNEYGGVYKLKSSNYTVLFKQGRNDGETICEYLASQLYELIIPGYAAKVFFAKFKENTDTFFINTSKNIHPEIYIGTVFFEKFTEINKLMGHEKRRRFLQTFHSNKSEKFVNQFKLTNLGQILAAALWLGDYDVHVANLGVVNWEKETQNYLEKWGSWTNADYWKVFRFVKIDHGWSFAKITDKMNRHITPWDVLNPFIKPMKLFNKPQNPFHKPTNHFADYDYYDLYTNSDGAFCQTIIKLRTIEKSRIKNSLETAFQELNKFYGNVGCYSLKYALESTAKWIGCPISFGQEQIIMYLTDKLYNRAKSNIE